MTYKVYRTLTLSGEWNHVRLFVETDPEEGSGRIFHVIGSVLRGMEYETRPEGRPEDEPVFIPGSKEYLGEMAAEDMEKLEKVCESIEPPGAQVKLNGKPIDPSKPVRRCAQWAEEARQQLVQDGIVKPAQGG